MISLYFYNVLSLVLTNICLFKVWWCMMGMITTIHTCVLIILHPQWKYYTWMMIILVPILYASIGMQSLHRYTLCNMVIIRCWWLAYGWLQIVCTFNSNFPIYKGISLLASFPMHFLELYNATGSIEVTHCCKHS